ncbi:hypothetical protein CVU76_00035 [Candidatus Dojkabacteria bacterium HGW-Dojkabacteria-1]|uniref:Calcineurin-like phosphoesterase domain-containing protein n=1 Tax=Candidatus Dojkabacteria bacterium HGW-Dojkabacteria-1 TaxID=2013761 RepID=A0A2N2F2H5_9BACT|nr:MAG: hypothetical protein CVU76_00035 [Candidatus Dojkabacteria bacterium HGW-Dojkabacteria-1]
MVDKEILIVSDIHLGRVFNEKKFHYLCKLFSSFERIVINGDFWCYYSFNFDSFLNSEWKGLFPILKSRNTTYIYGNHDLDTWMDTRVYTFCNLLDEKLFLEMGSKRYLIEHGHMDKDGKNQSEDNNKLRFMIERYINPFQYVIIQNVQDVRKNVLSKAKIYSMNNSYKKYAKENLLQHDIYITGHTHLPEIDVENKYLNSGYIGKGFASYIVINSDGPSLKNEKYSK